MNRVQRIVKRQTLKQELQNLKEVMKTSQPLIQADRLLRNAYLEGYRKRLTEEIAEAEKAKTDAQEAERARSNGGVQQQPAVSAEQATEPGNDSEDQGCAEANEETPVRTLPADDGVHL